MFVSCRHPKFDDTLFVSELPVHKKPAKLTGNVTAALDIPMHIAKNVRDELLEHRTDVLIWRQIRAA